MYQLLIYSGIGTNELRALSPDTNGPNGEAANEAQTHVKGMSLRTIESKAELV